ncbi:potassium-transporting ATPase subunit B, partial [Motilibacter sp. E257]|nr:potassium-transporting ATPase subunit B [Motilibacter deserti]
MTAPSSTREAPVEAQTSPGAAPGRQPEHRVSGGLLDPRQLVRSLPDAVRKLDPRRLARNPVMLVVEAGSALATVLAVADPSVFAWVIVVWLWLTVVFANLAEATAEGRGKAQAATLRQARTTTTARRLGRGGGEEHVAA